GDLGRRIRAKYGRAPCRANARPGGGRDHRRLDGGAMSKTKTEDGHEYTAGAYAYVGDPEDPSTWKLRIEETPGKVTAAQLGRAAAAFSPGGFRGRRVEIPEADVA